MENSQEQFIENLFIFDDSPTINRRKGSVSYSVECRICLEEEVNGLHESLISPCLCSGSVKYVHFSCMCQWIKKNSANLTSTQKNSNSFECEMCKYKIQYECNKKSKLNSFDQFVLKAKSHKYTFTFLIIVLTICLSLIIAGIYLMSTMTMFHFVEAQLFQSLVILVSTILITVLFILSSYMLVVHFIIGSEITITKIYMSRPDSPRKKSTLSLSGMQTDISLQMKRRMSRSNISNMTIFPLQMVIEHIE